MKLCRVVEEFDFPVRYLYGHITLVSYIGQNEANFVEQCKAALKNWRAFSVTYNCVELLSPTPSIVASPELSQKLVAIHDSLLSVAPSEMDSWSAKEVWHPHTTLFYHTEADRSNIQRHEILRRVMDSGLYSKTAVIIFLDWLISRNEKVAKKDMSAALEKWRADRKFVANYDLKTQRVVKVRKIIDCGKK